MSNDNWKATEDIMARIDLILDELKQCNIDEAELNNSVLETFKNVINTTTLGKLCENK